MNGLLAILMMMQSGGNGTQEPPAPVAPPPTIRLPASPPMPVAEKKAELIEGFVTEEDYPIDSFYLDEEGTVVTRMTIKSDGTVGRCQIDTSATLALDARTCAVLTQRFRYKPAQNGAGQRISEIRYQPIRWALPAGTDEFIDPYLMSWEMEFGANGQIINCTVQHSGYKDSGFCEEFADYTASSDKRIRVDKMRVDTRLVSAKNEYALPALPAGKWSTYIFRTTLTVGQKGDVQACSRVVTPPSGKSWSGPCSSVQMSNKYRILPVTEESWSFMEETRVSLIGKGNENRFTPPRGSESLARKSDQIDGFVEVYDDYPTAAILKGEEGITRVSYTVDAAGYAKDCSVVQSSGSAILDSTTCRLIERKARFKPAHDEAGKAVAEPRSEYVDWKLPKQKPTPATPYSVTLDVPIQPDGRLGECELKTTGTPPAGIDFCVFVKLAGSPPKWFMDQYPNGGSLFLDHRFQASSDYRALPERSPGYRVMAAQKKVIDIRPDGSVARCEITGDSENLEQTQAYCTRYQYDPAQSGEGDRQIVDEWRVVFIPN